MLPGWCVCLVERAVVWPPREVAGSGILSRLLVPRKVRRAAHPVRAVKRASTPKVVKTATRAIHPIDNAVYGVERSVATSLRSGGKRRAASRRKGRAAVYRHAGCPVAHRTAQILPVNEPAPAEALVFVSRCTPSYARSSDRSWSSCRC